MLRMQMLARTALGAPDMVCRSGGPSGSRRRSCGVAVEAMYDPRFRFGPYNRRFRPNSGGSIDNSSWRDARAAKLREARQEILRKREEAESALEQRLDEEEDLCRNPPQPDEVVQKCLAFFRKGDIDSVLDLCATNTLQGLMDPVYIGNQSVIESGPLHGCHGLMHVAARRVLPGHLLRRCKVLSAFRFSDSMYHSRVAITGCTGEEVVLSWQLGRDRFGFWRVESISLDDGALPEAEVHGPHPRLPPEAVVAAQLRQLQAGEVEAAEAFVVRCGTERPAAGSGLLDSSMGEALVRLLSAEGVSSEVGLGALPSQRRFLQEVNVTVPSREGVEPPQQICLVWGLSVQANGCWMVDSIVNGDNPLD